MTKQPIFDPDDELCHERYHGPAGKLMQVKKPVHHEGTEEQAVSDLEVEKLARSFLRPSGMEYAPTFMREAFVQEITAKLLKWLIVHDKQVERVALESTLDDPCDDLEHHPENCVCAIQRRIAELMPPLTGGER